MRRRMWATVIGLGAALVLAGCGEGAEDDGDDGVPGHPGMDGGTGQDGGSPDGGDPGMTGMPDLTASLQDPDGTEMGTVFVTSSGEGTEFRVEVHDLPPGFHGLHLHEVGVCEPDSPDPDNPAETGDFLSAGGHIGVGESDHGQHPGDLPSLYVEEAGTGLLVTRTDALTVDEILADDGSALIVHSDRDNFAHIPERYAPEGPDQDTLDTGDAGDRLACAALTE